MKWNDRHFSITIFWCFGRYSLLHEYCVVQITLKWPFNRIPPNLKLSIVEKSKTYTKEKSLFLHQTLYHKCSPATDRKYIKWAISKTCISSKEPHVQKRVPIQNSRGAFLKVLIFIAAKSVLSHLLHESTKCFHSQDLSFKLHCAHVVILCWTHMLRLLSHWSWKKDFLDNAFFVYSKSCCAHDIVWRY